jgi:hypothetical protein
MKAGDHFRSFEATGCGKSERAVAVKGDGVEISVASRWMGQSPFAAHLWCRHVGVRGPFGWMRVVRFAEVDGNGVAHERGLPTLPFPPILEYIEVPGEEAALTMPDEGDLAEMRDLGYATWNSAWRLLLWVHPFFEHPAPFDEDDALPPAEESFSRALRMLDKARFERVAS